MRSKLISNILGVGIAASTIIALGGALLVASPASADTTKWTKVNTPSWTDGVILPASDILDYAVSGDDGNTIYVVAEVDRSCANNNPFLLDSIDNSFGTGNGYGVFKSTDGGVTWKDITDKVISADNLPNFNTISAGVDETDIYSLNYVAVAPDDANWVAVTGYANAGFSEGTVPNNRAPFTVASQDGGIKFAYTGVMADSTNGTSMDIVYDTDVSITVDKSVCPLGHLIAAMGFSCSGPGSDNAGVPSIFAPDTGTVYIFNAGTFLAGAWEDAGFYKGWDGSSTGNKSLTDKTIHSYAIVSGKFSPNPDDGCGLVVIGVAQYDAAPDGIGVPYVQMGGMLDKVWGDEAAMPKPIEIMSGSDTLVLVPSIWAEGIALPADFDASTSSHRIVFGYVDALSASTGKFIGFVFRIDDSDVSSQVAPSGYPLLASIAVNGNADTGKMMIGEYAKWNPTPSPGHLIPPQDEGVNGPCDGVRVWHTEQLDICCPKWQLCCKCPCGPYAARVAYSPDGSKEYATTTGSDAKHAFKFSGFSGFSLELPPVGYGHDICIAWGTPGDESSFSLNRDDATSWNTIGLIDTKIDYLSDMVVCPDCSVIYLSTINDGTNRYSWGCEQQSCGSSCWAFSCDSIWRSFDNGKTWERVNQGDWSDGNGIDPPGGPPVGTILLRLPCVDSQNCCDNSDPSSPGGTIWMGVQNSNDMWYSRDCGQCWTKTPDTKITIQDFAVDTADTVYVLDSAGEVSKGTGFCRRWVDKIDTGAGSGHMINVCCNQGDLIVVGPENFSGDDKVAWSDDGGTTWNQTDKIPEKGEVHVACATTCDNTIFIAVDSRSLAVSCIYRTTTDSGAWTNMNAADVDYTGIAVGRSDGTLYATTDDLGVNDNSGTTNSQGSDSKWTPCQRTFGTAYASTGDSEGDHGKSGPTYAVSAVARNLDPCTTPCCGTDNWDYLICGLDTCPTTEAGSAPNPNCCSVERFDAQPNALDICGCLTTTTNTKLYAIDSKRYDVRDGSQGTLWTYEDCAAKVGPTLASPADGSIISCMGCEGCGAGAFDLKWNRLCNSCSYDIEIMDDQGNVVVSLVDQVVTGTTCNFFFQSDNLKNLTCGSSYQWHVREANTDCECIHSRWSDTWKFTVATSTANGEKLISPAQAATDIGTTNVGFSWTSVANATSYTFVLSPNANLSGALVSQEISTTAYNYAGPLDNSKTYYWQVKAWKGTTLLSTSDIGVFTVVAKPVAAPPPVVVQQTPPPVINIPPAQQITPTWIYAIIGIGAALAVVVIVLIVRTRRP